QGLLRGHGAAGGPAGTGGGGGGHGVPWGRGVLTRHEPSRRGRRDASRAQCGVTVEPGGVVPPCRCCSRTHRVHVGWLLSTGADRSPTAYDVTGNPAAFHAWNPPTRSVARPSPNPCRD